MTIDVCLKCGATKNGNICSKCGNQVFYTLIEQQPENSNREYNTGFNKIHMETKYSEYAYIPTYGKLKLKYWK